MQRQRNDYIGDFVVLTVQEGEKIEKRKHGDQP